MLFAFALFSSCEKEERYDVFDPSQKILFLSGPDELFPGSLLEYNAKGFKIGDTIVLVSTANNTLAPGTFKSKANVTAFTLGFRCPEECRGDYDMNLLRDGKMTFLDKKSVISDIMITNIEYASSTVRKGGVITLKGDGILGTDEVLIKKSGVIIEKVSIEFDGVNTIQFNLPEEAEGLVDIVLKRGVLTKNLVQFDIVDDPVQIGDFVHGGFVFWQDPMTLNGLVMKRGDRVSSPDVNTSPWGPIDLDVMTSEEIGSGDENQSRIIEAINAHGTGWVGTKGREYMFKAADEYSVEIDGVVYDDWFVPARKTLDEIYRHHVFLNSLSPNPNINPNSTYASSSQAEISQVWMHRFTEANDSSGNKENNYNFWLIRKY